MNTAQLNQIQLNSAPSSGGKSKSYTRDMRLVNVRTKTYTRDMVLQKNQTKTYTRDMVIQGGSIKFYSRDMVLVTTYRDNGAWVESVGNNLSQPIDLNAIGHWSTYSRPTVTNYTRPVVGLNSQTGKIEYWDPVAGAWKNYDGTLA